VHDRGDHHHGLGDHRHRAGRSLRIALTLNAAFLVVEIVGGFAFHSLALLADGVHMVSDVVALTIAAVAASLALRPPTERHTYGLGRAEVLAASVNAVVLLIASTIIVIAAIGRFGASVSVHGGGVIVVAAIGLVVNATSAFVLARDAADNINVRAALWHMLGDVLGSCAALVAGIGIVVWNATWLDPVASIAVTVLVVVGGWRVLHDAVAVLLDSVPAHIDHRAVVAAILDEPGVNAAHHVHLWTIATGEVALSAHVVLDGERSLHEAQELADRVKARLVRGFGIGHSTLEVECHPCTPEESSPH
jgi:cobalt-zinc-cadmium efflux system protein